MDSTLAALMRWIAIVVTLGGTIGYLPAPVAPVAAGSGCTWYLAPGEYADTGTAGKFGLGNTTNTGTAPSSPIPFFPAIGISSIWSRIGTGNTNPNVVLCLEGGTYQNNTEYDITRGGNASGYMVIRPFNSSPVTILANHIPDNAEHGIVELLGAQYVTIEGLTIDGGGGVLAPLFIGKNGATYAHHIRLYNNVIQNGAMSGIQLENTDYVDIEGNIVRYNGHPSNSTFVPNANESGSGISDNLMHTLDTSPGFHAIITNNIVVGSSDMQAYVPGAGAPSDGNGIIMDLSENYQSGSTATNAATPPTLIANNVIYESYGRCIITHGTSNDVVTNNTCYGNSQGFIAQGVSRSGEVIDAGTIATAACVDPVNNHFYNNIVYGFAHASPIDYGRNDAGSCATFANESWVANTYWVGTLAGLPAGVTSDSSQINTVDPQFTALPPLASSLADQTSAALSPAALANDLVPRAGSPMLCTGTAPTTLSGWVADSVTSSSAALLAAQMAPYVNADLRGQARPSPSGCWDRGAYQVSS